VKKLEEGLYNAKVVCPICEKEVVTTRVKTAAVRLSSSDEDFCMHYEGLDPMLYDVWVCKYCGFTEFGVYFDKVAESEMKLLKELCLNRFTDDLTKEPFELTEFHKRVYAYFDLLGEDGERDHQAAIEAFKLLLTIQEVTNAPFSSRAKAAVRIGWIYRMLGDEQEMKYLEMAAAYFTEAFASETFSGGGLDSETCAYIIGELNRRVGKTGEAIEWFGKALRIAQENKNQKISNMIREQIQVAKKEAEIAKKNSKE